MKQRYKLKAEMSLRYGYVWWAEPKNTEALNFLLENVSPWNTPYIG